MNTGIYSISQFTMLDYPDHLACIIWFAGCNMLCQYCHNPQIVIGESNITLDEVKSFLESRTDMLEAVVLSGGEATLYKDLVKLATYIKSLGYKVKLDTNGINYKVIKKLVDNNLVDYVALDYKGYEDKFLEITTSKHWDKFQDTLKMLIAKQDDINLEIRTTWHSELLSSNDIQDIVDDLKKLGYKKDYYLQQCNPATGFVKLPDSQKVTIKDISCKDVKVILR